MPEEQQKPNDYTQYVEILENRVLIRPATMPEKTAGGIFIPDTAKGRADQGVVVAAGPGPGNAADGKMTVELGDSVLFGKQAGIPLKIDDEELILLRESDIFLILVKAGAILKVV